MIPSEKDVLVEARMKLMAEDARALLKLIEERNVKVKANEEGIARENKERQDSLADIRKAQSKARITKNKNKEEECKTISRTIMANLVSAADYPGAPRYVPDMINVLQNILSK